MSHADETTVELSDVESYHYLMKCLWDHDATKKNHVTILDTVLYKAGRPHRWLFTNNDGCVMKKKDENLNSREIIRVFKARSKAMQGSKHHEMTGKIAIVWYVDDKNNIQSYFVDDLQLRSILEENVYECLAVQLYIGGFPLKGSGIFEHRFWMRSNGTSAYQTSELLHAKGHEVTTYTPNTDRLTITDYQHDALKAVCKRVVHILERNMRGTVANIVLNVVFSKSWGAFVVGARGMLFWNPDSKITMYRAASLYACDPPVPPSAGQRGSHLLPASHLDPDKHVTLGMPLTLPGRALKTPYKAQTMAPGTDAVTGEDLFDVFDAPNTEGKHLDGRNGESKEGDHPHHHVEMEGKLDKELHQQLHVFGAEVELDHGKHYSTLFPENQELAAESKTGVEEGEEGGVAEKGYKKKAQVFEAASDHLTGPSGFNDDDRRNNDEGVPNPALAKHPATGQLLKRAVSKYNDTDLLFMDGRKTLAMSQKACMTSSSNDRFLNGEGHRPLGASDRGPHYPEQMGTDPHPAHLGVVSAAVLHATSMPAPTPADMDDPMIPRKASTVTVGLRKQSIVMSRLARPVTADASNRGGGVTFQQSQTVLPGKKKGAIHNNAAYGQTESSRTRLEFYANQLKHVESVPIDKLLKERRAISAPHGTRKGRGGIALDGPNHHISSTMLKSGKLAVGGHGVHEGGKRSSGFERPVPLQSGTVCYGDYCFMQADVASGSESIVASSSAADLPASVSNEESVEAQEEKDRSGGAKAESGGNHAADLRHDGGGGRGKASGSKSAHKDSSESKLNPNELQPPILPYQLPFRSVLLLRSEENHLRTKLYEPWQYDDSIMESKAVLEAREVEYQVIDHQKKLLDLTRRHLKRIAYTCLHDVRRTVTPMPQVHATGSGFTHQWHQLSMSYRKLVYADALSKTHPSRFYQTVPMCETCQYVYSMADMFRDEIVFGGHAAGGDGKSNKKSGRSSGGASSPGKHTDGIEEARMKGLERRRMADSEGSFKSREYGSPRRGPKKGGRNGRSGGGVRPSDLGLTQEQFDEAFMASVTASEDNDNYDFNFETVVPGAQGMISGDGVDTQTEIARIEAMEKKYGNHEDDDDEGIGPDGKASAIGAWVAMLTEQAQNGRVMPPDEQKNTQQHQQQGYGDDNNGSGTSQGHRAGPDSAPSGGGGKGKPNPMGPLAGLGVGNPLGQYRGLAAPVGYMLGQGAGSVGTRVIDEKGNFVYQKKRSPAETHSSAGASAASPTGFPAATIGIAFGAKRNGGGGGGGGGGSGGKRSVNGNKLRPQSAVDGRTKSRGKNSRAGEDGYANTTGIGGGTGPTLVDIAQYQFQSVTASRLTSELGVRPKSANTAVRASSARQPESLPPEHEAASSKDDAPAVDDYMFTSLPGGDAPLIPLSSLHRHSLQRASDNITTLPTYSSGGTSFEAMIRNTHTAAEAYKTGAKLYGKRRPTSGPAAGRMSGRRREIHEEKERKRREEEEVAARGYLGGMDMDGHVDHVRNIYTHKNEKLVLGRGGKKGEASQKVN